MRARSTRFRLATWRPRLELLRNSSCVRSRTALFQLRVGLLEGLLGALARRDVLKENGQAPVFGGIGLDVEPRVPGAVIILELHRHLFGHGPAQLELERGAPRGGKQLPVGLADLVLPPDAVDALGLGVHVGVAPVPVQRDEAVGDALQDRDRALVRLPRLGEQLALPAGRLAADAGHLQVGAHPGEQFPAAERLDHVVIGHRDQALDARLLPAPGREQHHGRGLGRGGGARAASRPNPSRPGIITSASTRSGGHARATASATTPSDASSTS